MVIELEDIESFEEIELQEVWDLTIEDNSNYYLHTNTGKILVHNSGKTYSGIDFIVILDTLFPASDIIIVRETYNSFKTTLYSDFNRRLPQWLIPSPFEGKKELQSFWLPNKSKVTLMGADDPAKFHGAGSDFFFINEALDVSNEIFDQLEQRCRRFWWMDYNPKVSDHWIYNKVCPRGDVGFLHSTIKDNPYVSKNELRKVLSYDPTNPANEQTADDYMWNVYGLGKRSAPEGLCFPVVKWIDEFPDDVGKVMFGLDLGYTNSPACLVKTGVNGNRLFAKKLFYLPLENAETMKPYLNEFLPKGQHFWVDSADPQFINDLRRMNFAAMPVRKQPGYKKSLIGYLKGFELNFVSDADVRREQTNYKYRVIHGIRLDEPIDDFDHFFDALFYSTMHELRWQM